MAEPAATVSRGRTIALVVSLALNVLLVGVIAVGVTRAVNRGFIVQPGGPLAPGAVMRVVSEARRPAIRDIQLRHRDAMRRDRQEARRARLEAFRLFGAPDYDRSAFDKALAQVREADGALEDEAIAMAKDVVATLTPEERKAVVERARRPRHWWDRWLPN
jgi:uncharacterized membrane protein